MKKQSPFFQRQILLDNKLLVLCFFAVISFPRIKSGTIPHKPFDSINGEQRQKVGTCESISCLKIAFNIFSYLDEDIDPCDDFYEFACGNFHKYASIPDGKNAFNAYSKVEELVQLQLRKIFDQPLPPNESKAFRLVKQFYSSCLNETLIEERGLQPLFEILDSYGGWPVVKGDAWKEDDFDWINTVGYIFGLDVAADMKNSSKYVLYITESDHDLHREFLIEGMSDPDVELYYNIMVDNAVILGANEIQAKEELQEALEFEIRLAKIEMSREEARNITLLYNPYTIKELQLSYPYIPWLEYINLMLPNGINVTENETIINTAPTYFEKLENILNSTSKRAIANYVLWRFVLSTSQALTAKLRNAGLIMSRERWRECVDLTSTNFQWAVGALYVRKYFREETRRATVEMVKSIRNEFIDILRNATWLDDVTRGEAIKKAKLMDAHIGYPIEFHDNRRFDKLRESTDAIEWEITTVNAFNIPNDNSIVLPAATLQDPLFSMHAPNYMNYACLGSIIGHEITHSFDDLGRQLDYAGNLVDWWDSKTKTLFLESAQCIIEQYSKYVDVESNYSVNGINTLDENIADNGGVRAAYFAYFNNWAQHHKPEKLLPILSYDQKQLFWISYGQTYCELTTKNYNKWIITVDEHSPNKFRVNGVLSNIPQFAQDFNCPIDAKMNPTKKCTIW
ncbi:neprilysin-2-like isoform X2 [Contarinia nasturtii]|uniref:neprilysin-2-like isoform X2 n=1 Tax=Contarinia nasturtii TaxID=265458 RepID=UPI0012D45EA2|nr:neprilysin-2-like isoform X2 [Contarinia nasturtii]